MTCDNPLCGRPGSRMPIVLTGGQRRWAFCTWDCLLLFTSLTKIRLGVRTRRSRYTDDRVESAER